MLLLYFDVEWIGVFGVVMFVGLFIGILLFGYICDKVGWCKMFLFDIIVIGVIFVVIMFVFMLFELLVMCVLIGIVIGVDYFIVIFMIMEFFNICQCVFFIGFIVVMWYVGVICVNLVGYWLYDMEGGWCWMFGSVFILCLIILIGCFDLLELLCWLL